MGLKTMIGDAFYEPQRVIQDASNQIKFATLAALTISCVALLLAILVVIDAR